MARPPRRAPLAAIALAAIVPGLAPAPLPAAAPPVATAPSLAACPVPDDAEGGERNRRKPLPVPPAMARILTADLLHYAVATLAGGTVCVDTSWIEAVDHIALSSDGRFLGFDWLGYEAYGHVLVDRAGKGTVVETGVAPLPSPSGRRLAAVEYTESGFGSLNGLGVWDISGDTTREMARLDFAEGLTGWRLDGWQGERCLRLSAVAFEDLPDDGSEPAEGTRQRFIAREGGAPDSWTIAPHGAGGAAPCR